MKRFIQAQSHLLAAMQLFAEQKGLSNVGGEWAGGHAFLIAKNGKAQQGKPGRFLYQELALFVEFQLPKRAVSQLCQDPHLALEKSRASVLPCARQGGFGAVSCMGPTWRRGGTAIAGSFLQSWMKFCPLSFTQFLPGTPGGVAGAHRSQPGKERGAVGTTAANPSSSYPGQKWRAVVGGCVPHK